MMINTILLYILSVVYVTLTLIEGHRDARSKKKKKKKKSALHISQICVWVWIELGMLLRLLNLMNLVLILSSLINIQGIKSNIADLVPPPPQKKKTNPNKPKKKKKNKTKQNNKQTNKKTKQNKAKQNKQTKQKHWLEFRQLWTDFFQSWYVDKYRWSVQLDITDGPRPSLKVTVIWESRNFCAHFLANFSIDMDEIWYDTMNCSSV